MQEPMGKRAARGRLVRAAIAAIVMVWGLVLASFGQLRVEKIPGRPDETATWSEVAIALGGAAIALIAGIVASRSVSRAVRLAMRDQVGEARSAPAGVVVSAFGYIIVLFVVLSALDVDLGGLLLGGALTG